MPVPRKAFRHSLKKLYDWLDSNVGGEAEEVTSDDITDAGEIGKLVIQSSTQEQARTATGAASAADLDALVQRVEALEG